MKIFDQFFAILVVQNCKIINNDSGWEKIIKIKIYIWRYTFNLNRKIYGVTQTTIKDKSNRNKYEITVYFY
jgi:hypothetical protein